MSELAEKKKNPDILSCPFQTEKKLVASHAILLNHTILFFAIYFIHIYPGTRFKFNQVECAGVVSSDNKFNMSLSTPSQLLPLGKVSLILLISLNHSSFRLCLSLELSFQKIKNESLDASVAYLQQKQLKLDQTCSGYRSEIQIQLMCRSTRGGVQQENVQNLKDVTNISVLSFVAPNWLHFWTQGNSTTPQKRQPKMERR